MTEPSICGLADWAKNNERRVVFHPSGGISVQRAHQGPSEDSACSLSRLIDMVAQCPPAREPANDKPAHGYETLQSVFDRAWRQATMGKGAERHAQGRPFEQQPLQQLCDLYGVGFALGQAGKKAQEAQRLPRERAVTELLGAIVYLAGAIVHLERTASATEGARHGR